MTSKNPPHLRQSVVGSRYTWLSTSLRGGVAEWLFDGSKKITNFVCTYIWFKCIINIDSYLLFFVSSWVREEPQQEDEQACDEDPIIATVSLHTTTEDLERFISFPLWEGKYIVDKHVYIGISGHILWCIYDILYLMYDIYLMHDIIWLMTLLVNIWYFCSCMTLLFIIIYYVFVNVHDIIGYHFILYVCSCMTLN